ncbi:M20 family metallopeptidase [Phenylobacterium sp.]|uniref:M20 family metallopeptidase n=1 Tax=Phenylobacterium sp. TaxID=1871053 RepID=UPI00273695D2|nr:M20/M25/M40 family metallo-hydrolase [Phenylobacterium sp.]MDP3659687.1 M20/M25/M40 family metallo-hydrolase [Phenylobacterium sp.]
MAAIDPTDVRPNACDLTHNQLGWIERAWGLLDRDQLERLISEMVDIPSPTGGERACAEYAVTRMREGGLDAEYQALSPARGNAVGRLRGDGSGPSLLLYGHFDHYIAGADDDRLVVGDLDHPSFRSVATRDGEVIHGAGAGNPKAGAAAAILAAQAVAASGAKLCGDVIVGLVSGGIHRVQAPHAGRPYVGEAYEGQGIGTLHMLRHGVQADYCLSTKPGYRVVWEEPGVVWIKLTVQGVVGYSARRGVFRRAISDAARLIPALEDWFESYAERHSDGQVATPGHVGAIEGGWPFKPDFSPSVCNLYLDLRISPRSDVREVLREFAAFVDGFRADNPDISIAWEPYSSMPGTATDPANWIVQSAMRAWEAVEGSPHRARTGLSGMTDAAVLRTWGIPTARLGGEVRHAGDPAFGFLSGEGADLDVMMRVARCYVFSIIDTCTRSLAEVRATGADLP